jgi:hypothetical protein
MTTRSILDLPAEREQAVHAQAEYLRVQLELTSRVSELEAELAGLATTRKVLLTLDAGETEDSGLANLPDNPVYQHILTALTDVGRPVRAKDVCQALDIGLEPKHIEACDPSSSN